MCVCVRVCMFECVCLCVCVCVCASKQASKQQRHRISECVGKGFELVHLHLHAFNMCYQGSRISTHVCPGHRNTWSPPSYVHRKDYRQITKFCLKRTLSTLEHSCNSSFPFFLFPWDKCVCPFDAYLNHTSLTS